MSSGIHQSSSKFGIDFVQFQSAKEAHYNLHSRGETSSKSLPLQMALYFNIFYFPVWLVIEIVTLCLKFDRLTISYRVIIICILICMSFVEVIRIYLGYVGNLLEKMPELAAHWILTTVIQLPQLLFLLVNEAVLISPLERISSSVLLAFLVLEVVFGFSAMRKTVGLLAIRYRTQQIQGSDGYLQESSATYDNRVFKDE